MARRPSGWWLLLFLGYVASGHAGLRAEDAARDGGATFSFPIYQERADTTGLSITPSPFSFSHESSAPFPFSDANTAAYDPVTRPWTLPLAKLLDPRAEPAAATEQLGDGRQDWLASELVLPPGQSLRRQTDGLFGSVTAQVSWRDPRALREEPALDSPWKSDHNWQLSLAGPVFVFGQFGAAQDPVTTDEMKLQGKTGVGCKIPVPFGIEVQLRGGPAVKYSDPLAPGGTGEHSELFVEVQCRCPLPGQLGLEYQGSAVPALTPLERDRINQDLGLALPVGDGGKLRLGAKHQWESTPTPKPWRDGMQLYVGFELGGGTSKQ
jgi:hypothetical protein